MYMELCDVRWFQMGENFVLSPNPEQEEGICRYIILQYAALLATDSFSDMVIL